MSPAPTRWTRPAPALQAMPVLLFLATAAVNWMTRQEFHAYRALQFGVTSRHAASLSDLMLHPGALLYPHLLWLVSWPIRAAAATPDTLAVGQALSALAGGCGVALFYILARRLTVDWRASLLAALFLAFCFSVWHVSGDCQPQAPALALGLGALMLVWPKPQREQALGRAVIAGLLLGAATLLNLAALLWMAPLCAAAAWGHAARQAVSRAACVAAPALALSAAGYAAAAVSIVNSGAMSLEQWLAFLAPMEPEADGAFRLFLLFKTLKFGLLYRTPWFIGLPLALAFLGLPAASRRLPAAVCIFGLWAAAGAVRAPFLDPAEIQAWSLAMPGVMGLFAVSLDAALDWRRAARLRTPLILVGSLTLFLFIGNNHGWLPRFERAWGSAEARAATLAALAASESPYDLILVPNGLLVQWGLYAGGSMRIYDPSAIEQITRAEGADPAQWIVNQVVGSFTGGASVFIERQFLDPESDVYRSGALPAEAAAGLKNALTRPATPVEGVPDPYELWMYRID